MNSPEIQLTEQVWRSLKIIIFIIATLAPFIIIFLVFRYNRIISRLKRKHETDQKIVEKRIEIYDRIAPKLNDLLSFYCYNGTWIKISPLDVLRLKRELDKEINIYTPLFSDELGKKYSDFIGLCFVSFSGWEHEVKIKSLFDMRKEHNVDWNNDWIKFFDTKNVIDAIKMKEHYNELMAFFKKELNI